MPLSANAQLIVGIGSSIGASYFLDRQAYYNSLSPGIGLHISYCPPNNISAFYPSASFYIHQMQIPVFSSLLDGLTIPATSKCWLLNLNYKLTDNENNFIAYGGIGVSHIAPDVTASVYYGPGSIALALINEGNSEYYPTLNTGIIYLKHISKKAPLYLGIDGQLKYIYIYQNGKYYVQNTSVREEAYVSGNMIFPSLVISINYAFERRDY